MSTFLEHLRVIANRVPEQIDSSSSPMLERRLTMIEVRHDGKAGIVTGGSRGIGLAIARELISSGARVLITGRKQPALEAAAEELGDNCMWQVCHAADAEAAKVTVARALQDFGQLDLLVNNAGVNPQWGPTIEVDHGLANKLVEVNQWAPLMWTQLAWHASMRDRGGAIVNITSIAGMAAGPMTGFYNATKAALGFLTRQLAAELAPAVRVNAVAPGLIATDMAAGLIAAESVADGTPLGRHGLPQDIAAAVSFLLSSHASWVTGQILAVDGGALEARGWRSSWRDEGPDPGRSVETLHAPTGADARLQQPPCLAADLDLGVGRAVRASWKRGGREDASGRGKTNSRTR